ncbi:MAG: M48 family metallopeptidase, partial [Bacteroidota bacterium]
MEHASPVPLVGPERQEGSAPFPSDPVAPSLADRTRNAKSYSRAKLLLGAVKTGLFFLFSLVVLLTGLSTVLEEALRGVFQNDYLVLLAFVFTLGAAEGILTLPLRWYSGFHLEHRYRLSNQSFGTWVREGAKGMLIGGVIAGPIVIGVYFCLVTFGTLWWLPVGAFFVLLSVVLARIAPVLIFPLFYTFKPVEEGSLRDTVVGLCEKVGMQVTGVFVFDMSKNTKKANAAFAGIGKSKRVLLGDTLVTGFPEEEIETVFAHELGHYTLGHIGIMMVVGTVSTFAGLYLTSLAYEASLGLFGLPGIATIAALPLLSLWLGVFSLVSSPLLNILSRSHENEADRF